MIQRGMWVLPLLLLSQAMLTLHGFTHSSRWLRSTLPSHSHHQAVSEMNTPSEFTNQSRMDEVKELVKPFLEGDFMQHVIAEWTRPLPPNYLSRPLVIVGPSGVGKGRLLRSLLKDYSKFFSKVVSHTTRNPRPSEIAGVHYHFVNTTTFRTLVENGSFIEWAMVHGNYYGTSIRAWKDVQLSGRISILEIDIQGAKSVRLKEKTLGIFPRYIFIAPPDVATLQDRLDLRYVELMSLR